MQFSIFNGDQHDHMKYVSQEIHFQSLAEIGKYIISHNWSPSTFVVDEAGKNHRLKKNFKACSLLVLDIDDGKTIEEAKDIFKDYTTIIGTTKSHLKEKVTQSGKVHPACERFRVIIPFERTITTSEDYAATLKLAHQQWPFVDPSCKDSSRYYVRCANITAAWSGKSYPVQKGTLPATQALRPQGMVSVGSHKRELAKYTYKFLNEGATEGQWHYELFRSCADIKGAGYTQQEAIEELTQATRKHLGYLDEHDLALIRDVYEKREISPTPNVSQGLHQYAHAANRNIGTMQAPNFQKPVYQEESIDDLRKTVANDQRRRIRAIKNKLPFLCCAFDDIYNFSMGFVIIGAKSGKGKSTILANLIGHLVQNKKVTKKILIISNEETTEDVYSRIACVVLRINWSHWRNGKLSDRECEKIAGIMDILCSKITVHSITGNRMNMTYIEDVIATLTHIIDNQDDYGLVLFDYWQTVNQSRQYPHKTAVEISKELGFFLKEYAAKATIPFVAFAQLKSNADSGDIKDRIENDRTLYNHAQDFIEAVPNFETKQTCFTVHKQRWGEVQGRKVICNFENGRYVKEKTHV